MSGHIMIDLTGDVDGGESVGEGLKRKDPPDGSELRSQHRVASSDRIVPDRTQGSKQTPRSPLTTIAPSPIGLRPLRRSHRDGAGTQGTQTTSPIKRARHQGPNSSNDLVGGHQISAAHTEDLVGRWRPSNIANEPNCSDGSPAGEVDEVNQYHHFGSLHETPVLFDVRPRDNAELNVVIEPLNGRPATKRLLIIENVKGEDGRQTPRNPIGQVTCGHEKTFLFNILRTDCARVTLQIAKGKDDPTGRPIDRFPPGSTIAPPLCVPKNTANIYCTESIFEQVNAVAARLQGSIESKRLLVIDPDIRHRIEPDTVTATVKKPRRDIGKMNEGPSYSEDATEDSLIRRAFNALQPEHSLPETNNPAQMRVQLHKHQAQALSFMIGKENGAQPLDVSIQKMQDENNVTHFCDVISGETFRTRPIRRSGGILADGMGMGKTVEAVALILATLTAAETWFRNGKRDACPRNRGTLILVPPNLIPHWKEQILSKTMLQEGDIYVHHGPSRGKPDLAAIQRTIVLTSVALLVVDDPKDEELLFQTHWYRAIFDEAHHLRNRDTKSTTMAKRVQSEYKWLLTGSPIHNSIWDVQPLLELSGAVPVHTVESFRQYFVQPVEQNASDCGKRAKVLARTHMLRREARPELFQARRVEVTYRVALSKEERALYNKAKADANRKVQDDKSAVTALSRFHEMRRICALGTAFEARDAEPEHITTYKMLTDNGETCKLCGEVPSNEDTVGEIVCTIMPCQHVICARCSTSRTLECPCPDSDGGGVSKSVHKKDLLEVNGMEGRPTKNTISEKMRMALEDVKAHKDSKVVIMASYVDTVTELSRILQENHIGHVCVYGKVTPGKRQKALHSFNTNDHTQALVATMGTMGEGHSLIAASRLICMDMEWNPQILQQAYARVYRLDQKRDVTIIQLIAIDTVDEKIQKRSEKKKMLADAFMTDWNRVGLNDKEDLDDIKTWCRS